MPDLAPFLDKKPTESYTLGPTVLNVGATGYNLMWRAWYEEGVGIAFIPSGQYNNKSPTGYHASGSQLFSAADRMSFTFDSGARPWVAINHDNSINVYRFSGSGYSTQASFSGRYPVVYYNLAHNKPEYRFVHCFYLKSGQNKIYQRSSQNGFSIENIAHQDFPFQIRTLNHASRFEYHPNKMSILGLYENADGFQIVSDCFTYFETGAFANFSDFPEIEISGSMKDYFCSPSSTFTEETYMAHENFSAYPTGVINFFFNSGTKMSGGYIWL